MTVDTFLTVGLLMLMSMGVGAGLAEIAANRRRTRNDHQKDTP
jgi:hypothetical protein